MSFKGLSRFYHMYFLFRQDPFMWGLYFLNLHTLFVRIWLFSCDLGVSCFGPLPDIVDHHQQRIRIYLDLLHTMDLQLF